MKVLDAFPRLPDWFCDFKEESGGGLYCSSDCPLKNHRCGRLAFWVGRDGRLMLGCRAGCPKLEILRAVGMTWADTFPAGTKIDRQHQTVTARYPYRDEAGVLLYQTLRLEPGRGGRDKEFKQQRPTAGGGWGWSLGDVRRVLYRLPELLKADPVRAVFVVAGEKDADSLAAIGVVATTNVCGERAEWLESYADSLAGRNVVVIQDADAVGKRHVDEVCGALLEHVRTLRRVKLPEKDATAFLVAAGQRGISKPAALRAALAAVVSDSKLWTVGVTR